jgi:hypothetical protein
MPEFEGTSTTLSFQGALEEAVRKAYTAYQRRTHTEPLFSYVVKRVSGHLRTLTVVIETVLDDAEAPATPTDTPATPTDTPKEGAARAEAAISTKDPIRELLDKQRRNEPLTPNEQALIDLLRQDPTNDP